MAKKGFTLLELLLIFCSLVILIAIMTPTFQAMEEKARQQRCKANLDRIGKSLKLYTIDFGRSMRYPEKNGAGFITSLYQMQEKLVDDYKVYLCPSTTDTNDYGKKLASVTDTETKNNFVSYSGRVNKNPRIWPGVYSRRTCCGITTIASDDIQGKANHEEGDLMIFLYLDGHSDHIKSPYAEWENYSWNFNPLTN